MYSEAFIQSKRLQCLYKGLDIYDIYGNTDNEKHYYFAHYIKQNSSLKSISINTDNGKNTSCNNFHSPRFSLQSPCN